MAAHTELKYADLVIPISSCPFNEGDENCMFQEFRNLPDFYQKLDRLNGLPEEKVNALRKYHQKCMEQKILKSEGLLFTDRIS